MDYISRIDEKELTFICGKVHIKEYTDLFKKNSKEITKIKPGFRPNKIREEDAVSIAVKHIKYQFINSFINDQIKKWLDEIESEISDKVSEGYDEVNAIAIALNNSAFCENIEIYFTLSLRNAEKTYIDKVKKCMGNVQKTASIDLNVEAKDVVANQSNKSLGLQDDLNTCRKKLQKYESDISELKEALRVSENRVNNLENEKQKMEAELSNYRFRMRYDDTDKLGDMNSEYEYVSLCEVTYSEYEKDLWLTRLADIDKNGNIEKFYCNEYNEKRFNNRPNLYFNNGPRELGFIGVWNWNAIPNNNDPSRDYVTTHFSQDIEPIQIITFNDCDHDSEKLIKKLKSGIDSQNIGSKTLFSIHLKNGKYTGFACRDQDLEQNGSLLKLKESVISLPRYDFDKSQIVNFENDKRYFKNITLGLPTEIVYVRDKIDILKTIILSKSTWNSFKEAGKTRAEWKNIRSFLKNMDTTSIIDDIIDKFNCSSKEAKELMNDFMEYVDTYIDGTTIEDDIITSILTVNEKLMNRCKMLVREDWINENHEIIDKSKKDLNKLKNEIKNSETELNKLKSDYDACNNELQKITDDCENKKQFAIDVEAAVEKRIHNAQENAAEFLAKLAFIPQNEIKLQQISESNAVGSINGKRSKYIEGTEIITEQLYTNDTWNDVLDTIADELIDAGVMQNYARPLGAYIYSAYLNHISLLIVGPNSNYIVDAFSRAVFGRTAGIIECDDMYDYGSIQKCYSSGDKIVMITDPFSSAWVNKIPDICSNNMRYCIAVHPYSEDIQIEPKSIYSYMLPIFTELFVEKAATTECMAVGRLAENYKEFDIVKADKIYNKLLTELHTSALVRNNIQITLTNMHTMLNENNADHDVLFAILPYALATMQIPTFMNVIEGNENNKLKLSKGLLDVIRSLYGEE